MTDNKAKTNKKSNSPQKGEPSAEEAKAATTAEHTGETVARPRLLAAAAGILAAGAALASGELLASFATPNPGPVVGVASRVIDFAPNWFVDFGKAVFGLADKPALVVGTIIISLVIGAALGIAGRSKPAVVIAGFVAFGLLGAVSIGTDAQGSWGIGIVAALVAVITGIATLFFLLSTIDGRAGAQLGLRPKTEAATTAIASPTNPPVTRRRFMNWAGGIGVGAAAAAVGAREVRARSSANQARDEVVFTAADGASVEQVVTEAATGPVGATPGITPLVVPNSDFYRIDTALTTPQIDPANWSMTIRGMVDNELTFTYDELLERAETIAPVTLSCVSNPIGGNLVGNAVWRGIPLSELLDEAGVQAEATQIASRSVDGWTCGFPTEAAFDGRTALLAVGMNDEPLPLEHGFPARLVVSGLYGYVSATKWLKEIELTRFETFDGYWIPRGWSKLGPIKTQSRIDTPQNGQRVAVGETVPIAGVAWAPNTGITRVEVQVDDGEWMEAELGESLGEDAWVQWVVPWTATAGVHIFTVRATDETGETQTSQVTRPDPNGASGHHRIGVEVI